MKKILLFGFAMLFAGTVSSQIIFAGVSPSSIQGNYEFTYGEQGGGWGSVDLADPENSIQDFLVLYEDTDGSNLGCMPAGNEAEIEGHIAILFRGDCEFGMKTMNAEEAGAIACVIINNVPGSPVGMAPGANGTTVTIPVVMISDVDGAALLAEMENGPVEVFIGNKTGYFEYDLGSSIGKILRPEFASLPLMLANSSYVDTENNDAFRVNLGGYVHNYGSEPQTNVKLTAEISKNGQVLYSEESSGLDMESEDSVYFMLPSYAPETWEEGYYSLVYTLVSDNEDDYSDDNVFESDFVISATEFSYGSIDAETGKTNLSSFNRVIDGATGDPIPYFSTCLNFRHPNASSMVPTAISFAATISSGTDEEVSIEGEEFFVQVFEYADNFVDLNDPNFANPIVNFTDLMYQSYIFEEDLQEQMVTATFDVGDIVTLDDNQRYLFCATTTNPSVYFGFDRKRDYSENAEYYLQPLFPIEAGLSSINPVGFGFDYVPALSVSFAPADQLGLNKDLLDLNMKVYPSPASDVVNVTFNSNDVQKVDLINMMGQTVASQKVVATGNTSIDVSSLEAGMYLVKAYLNNNLTQTMRVIIAR